jgi:hypothetical protein
MNRRNLRHLSTDVTLHEVGEIVRADLPYLTDADLARILGDIWQAGSNPIATLLEPLVRAELTRRRPVRVREAAPLGY